MGRFEVVNFTLREAFLVLKREKQLHGAPGIPSAVRTRALPVCPTFHLENVPGSLGVEIFILLGPL